MTAREITARLYNGARKANYWITAQAVFGLLAILRLLPAERALNFAEAAARRVGPWSGRHKVAMENLARALPEMSHAEHERIALDMWGNMARLAAEYVFIDQLFDFDPQNPGASRVEVVGEDIFIRLREEKRPHIFFTAHLGNFELLPVAAASFGLDVTALFRAPNNPYIAKQLASRRNASMGSLLPSRAGAAFALARILERDGNIGMLVDQKFHRGIRTTFFGRECETSPLLPKLARQYDCDVYPARCTRLPGGRFRLEILEKIELPRNAGGSVDVAASAQQITDIVEGWVREDPGQWMWFHKRWKMHGAPRKSAITGNSSS